MICNFLDLISKTCRISIFWRYITNKVKILLVASPRHFLKILKGHKTFGKRKKKFQKFERFNAPRMRQPCKIPTQNCPRQLDYTPTRCISKLHRVEVHRVGPTLAFKKSELKPPPQLTGKNVKNRYFWHFWALLLLFWHFLMIRGGAYQRQNFLTECSHPLKFQSVEENYLIFKK